MKKSIIVLLVAVLAAGFAFAATTVNGSANIDFEYDLEDTDWGFANSQGTKTTFTFSLVSEKETFGSTGEGDVYAEIEATFKANLDWKVSKSTDGSGTWAPSGSWKVEIAKANIVAGDWTIGILGAGKTSGYAADYHLDDDGDPENDTVKALGKTAPGFNVANANYGKAGFGAAGNVDAETYKVYGWAETKDVEVAEGLTVAAAGAGYLAQDDKALAAYAKAAYAQDKLAADVAVDFIKDNKAKLEVAANVAYEPVTANVYYYTVDEFETNNLDAMVTVAVNEGVVSSVYADARNLISEQGQTLEAGVDFVDFVLTTAYASTAFDGSSLVAGVKGAVENVSFEAEYETNWDFDSHNVYEKVTYTADMFTVYEKVTAGFGSATVVKPEVGISSTAVIDNCTLALVWTGATFGVDPAVKGAVTASATIKF